MNYFKIGEQVGLEGFTVDENQPFNGTTGLVEEIIYSPRLFLQDILRRSPPIMDYDLKLAIGLLTNEYFKTTGLMYRIKDTEITFQGRFLGSIDEHSGQPKTISFKTVYIHQKYLRKLHKPSSESFQEMMKNLILKKTKKGVNSN